MVNATDHNNHIEQNSPKISTSIQHTNQYVISSVNVNQHIDPTHQPIHQCISECKPTRWSNHGTIIRTGITCKKIPLQKSIEFAMALKLSTTRYKQKKQKYFPLKDHQLAENRILVFGLQRRKKKDKSQFVTKSVGIIVMIIFM